MIPQDQIYQIARNICDDIPKLLDKFHIEYEREHNRYVFPCPVHGGDNPTGCSIFFDGETCKGNWVCWTHHCEEDYGEYILGFLQGVLSCRNDEEVTFPQVISCAKSLISNESFSVSNDKYTAKSREERILEIFKKEPLKLEPMSVGRETVLERLNIPSPYYLGQLTNKNVFKRRSYYTPETLKKYDIGDCMEADKYMSYRAVVPIYDEDFNLVGCSGRKIYENNEFPKWKNTKMRNSHIIYGLNHCKELIRTTMTVILVEGQGNVWRSHEAGASNVVALMGDALSDSQLILLERSGVQNIVILTDYDDAGEKAVTQIMKKGGRRFNYHRPELPTKIRNAIRKFYDKDTADISDMFNEEYQEHIINKLPKGFKVEKLEN